MKRHTVFGLIAALVLPLLLVVGCGTTDNLSPATTTPGTVPPLHGGEEAKMIEITADDFAANPAQVRDIELVIPGSLIVTLAANPTTGYSWTENATISVPVVNQSSYAFVAPISDAVGAPGKSVWVFDSEQTGTGTITLSYARPWESTPPVWTLTINVTVK
jgi:inhibitor of cysteine peptidase